MATYLVLESSFIRLWGNSRTINQSINMLNGKLNLNAKSDRINSGKENKCALQIN
jgi:hypothetical protein